MISFHDLGLPSNVLKAVDELGYATPTPVQEQAIPLALEGHDLIAAAKTGTGKTAAFSLPTLSILKKGAKPKRPRMLVLTPTRELAAQIEQVCSTVVKLTGHRVTSVVGGVGLIPQINRLQKGVDVLIATPGRLIDLMNQNAVDLSAVDILVLDEADRMLDMGFLPSVRKIVNTTPATRQTLLFSATVDESIMGQVGSMLHDPHMVKIAVKGETADTVEQYIAEVPHALKPALLIALLKERGSKRVIAFARTRHRADACCRKLKRAGFSAEAIHSDRSQNQRQRALDNFANGTTDILVATDVLARGIDVDDVAYVVNYDLPTQPEDYVHRIGRTGRAGSQGFAVSFVSPENASDLKAIEKFIKKSIPPMNVNGFDLEAAAAEAAARATKASAKNDPELAQAARELAKKERKKQKAREEREAEAAQAATKAKQRGKNDNARAKATRKPHSSSGTGKRTGSPSQQSGHKNTRSKSAPSARGDMRPGRAHRAALAEQRRKNSKRR